MSLCKTKLNNLLASARTEKDKARLLAVSAEHASDWLNAIPVPSLGLKLQDDQLRVCSALRLGTPMCHQHNCINCGTEVETRGTHGLSCRFSKGRIARHSHVNDIIKRALSSADFPSILEPNGLARADGKRPDGMTYFPWKRGKNLIWDFTCSDTLAPSHLATSSVSAGKIAELAENLKSAKYATLEDNYIVTPICVETLGPWGPSGLEFVKELGSKIANITGEPRSRSFLFQSISMAIQRGNVASVFGTVPSCRNLDNFFNL